MAPYWDGIHRIIFLFLYENICCGYSLEVLQQSASNEYHNKCIHGETIEISTLFVDITYPLLTFTESRKHLQYTWATNWENVHYAMWAQWGLSPTSTPSLINLHCLSNVTEFMAIQQTYISLHGCASLSVISEHKYHIWPNYRTVR